jgi:3-oxoacyl-[acyl-carrier protein] reductase
VALTYHRDQAAGRSCAAEIDATGARAAAFPFDLTAPASASDLIGQVAARFGGIDVLVSCAGGRDRSAPWGTRFEDLPQARWRAMLDTDLAAPYALLQAAVPAMRGRGWGRIILVSSGAGEEGWEGAAAYATAKAGLAGLARGLAWELGQDNILVNIVAAGLTLTERVRDAVPPEILDRIAARIPAGRLSEPADVAQLILFLASAANRNISGEILREGSATGRSAHNR